MPWRKALPLLRAALPVATAGLAGLRVPLVTTRCESKEDPARTEFIAAQAAIARLETENAELLGQLQTLQSKLEKPHEIYRIVITGGPCAGKTTAMTMLRERLENAGWRVFTVPEAATMLFHNGASYFDFLKNGTPGVVNFQSQLANLQMRLENTMHDLAVASGMKAVLICDRGVMDGKAYCSDAATWALVLDTIGHTESQVRDRRYDAVIHLVTAAQGAEKFYTLEQAEGGESSSRTETAQQARDQDERTVQAWVGHEHLHIIDNSTSFTKKCQRTVDRVFKTIGEDTGHGHALRKIKLPYMSSNEIIACAAAAGVTNICVFQCHTTYVSPTSRLRIRSDKDHCAPSFYLQTFREDPKTKSPRRQAEQLITSHSYMQLLKGAHAAGFRTLQKELVCFKWGGDVYEVNVFKEPEEGCILEVEAESKTSPIKVPPFLRGAAGAIEVTGNSKYNTRSFAGLE